eukprot:COSAG05_NODE_16369_length_347_cov_1.669355_1_plen_49_part_10
MAATPMLTVIDPPPCRVKSATATSGMPPPRATRGNVYNISGPRVRLKWK